MQKLLAKVRRRLFPPSEVIDGYDQPELVDVIFRKTLAYEPQGDWPEIRGASTVLDFGGGCGLHYKQAKTEARWAVVETAAMVERAKELATDKLRFFTGISEAKDWLGSVDVVHSDGAIQYTPAPLHYLKALCDVHADRMIWRRVYFSESPRIEMQTSYLGDNGPGSIDIAEKIVHYPKIAISESEFLAAHDGYSLEERGPDWFRFKLRA